jgi:two-component system, OmpR family, sensor kinase
VLPYLGTFRETNVRLYSVDSYGLTHCSQVTPSNLAQTSITLDRVQTPPVGPATASTRRPRRAWPLRTRLLLALLAFASVALIAFGTASGVILQHSLMARVNQQLGDTVAAAIAHDRPRGHPGPSPSVPGLPTDFRVYFFHSDGTSPLELPANAGATNGPALPAMNLASVRQRGSRPFTMGDTTTDGRWQVEVVPNPWGGTVAVAASLSATQDTVGRLAGIELVCGSILLALLAVTATIVVKIGLRPLTRIEHTAQAIAEGELDLRVADTDRRTETGRLGAALNVMLSRISAALTDSAQSERRLRRFVADASHELRTPLTSIRGFAELYRCGGAARPADVERLMARIESESTRMGLLVEDLLTLARLDHERSLDLSEVDLLVLAADAVHDAQAGAPDRRICLDAPHGAVHVIGDEHKLRQVVTNLVANAVTHTPVATPITVSVRQERTHPCLDAAATAGGELPRSARFAVLEVVDEGPGIPEAERARVFDRFYRADQARSRTNGGSGLGLAITAAILEAHSGRIEMNTVPGSGTSFRVLLAPA